MNIAKWLLIFVLVGVLLIILVLIQTGVITVEIYHITKTTDYNATRNDNVLNQHTTGTLISANSWGSKG